MTFLSLTFLDQATPCQVRNLSAKALAALTSELTALIALTKKRKQVLENGLQLKYLDLALDNLKHTGRITGLIRFKDGSYTILAEIPKQVIWDQGKLIQVLEQLPVSERSHLVKTTYTIDERQYIAWPDPFKDLFSQARTLKLGKPTFQFKGDNQ